MLSREHLQRRRRQFLEKIQNPVLLMAGGEVPRNYPANVIPYRADSNFLFFFSNPEPDSAALFDPEDKSVTLYLKTRTAEDALWTGPVPSFEEMRQVHDVDEVMPLESLREVVQDKVAGRHVSTIAVADPRATAMASRVVGHELHFWETTGIADPNLIQAIGQLRLYKDPEELAEIRRAAEITCEGHTTAMAHAQPGVLEQDLAGMVDGVFARRGCVPTFNTILTVRGEVLHNTRHDQTLVETDIVLVDAGAEDASGYCADVTRSWPAGGKFTAEGRVIYDVVLAAEKAAIEAAKPGVRYRDVHVAAARTIAEGLVELGFLVGNPTALVESGAHALFFPHGVGHLLGLDVHDMEAFGDAISYAEGRSRSNQFGLAYLRLDLDLEPGMTFTIEPGIYFVPAILHHEEYREKFKGQVNFERAEGFLKLNGRGFGGIRIEDDILCTDTGSEVLTADIPKEVPELEALVGSAVS